MPVLEYGHKTKLPRWDELSGLWGDEVEPKYLPMPQRKKRESVEDSFWPRSEAHTPRHRAGNVVLGKLTVCLGMVHLCSLHKDTEESDRSRKCRSFHHYDGLEIHPLDIRRFHITVSVEGNEIVRPMASGCEIVWKPEELLFDVTNLRSLVRHLIPLAFHSSSRTYDLMNLCSG